MRARTTMAIMAALVALAAGAAAQTETGRPAILSMSALAFAPDGTLLVGDSKGGAIFAVDVADRAAASSWGERFRIADLESKIAAALGTTADDVLIHDLAVHPVSKRVYLAVSRGGEPWVSGWSLPNDLGDATILLRVDSDGSIAEVPLTGAHARAELPNPVDAAKAHRWKEGLSLRVDTITDLAHADGQIYVAGLSNEEFASTMWKVPYPLGGEVSATTLEIFHGAHGAFETHAPIRTFVPYDLGGEPHLLAAYLCTPFVSFAAADLEDGGHVKGRTLAEFGSGNFPLDMVAYTKDGEDRLLIANSQLPLLIVKSKDIASFEGELLEEPATYTAGLPYEFRAGAGVQQMDLLSDGAFVMLQRLPGGNLDLVTLPVRRF